MLGDPLREGSRGSQEGDFTMTQHGKGGARFSNPSGGTASDIQTGTRLSLLELNVAKLEEDVKTLQLTVNDIRWGREHGD